MIELQKHEYLNERFFSFYFMLFFTYYHDFLWSAYKASVATKSTANQNIE